MASSTPPRRTQVGAAVGGLLFGVPAVLQNPEHRFYAGAVFGTLGMLLGAGAVAIFAPVRCPK